MMLLNIIAYNNLCRVSYVRFDGDNWLAVFKTNYTWFYFYVLAILYERPAETVISTEARDCQAF